MKFILGTKQKMTQVFDENGRVQPVTVIQAGPAYVTQVRSPERDSYAAVQIGYGATKPHRLNKAMAGHQSAVSEPLSTLREFRMSEGDTGSFNVGDRIGVDSFEAGDRIEVSAYTKGKGYQGAVKRFGFGGGPRSHGQKHSEREVGSIGDMGIQRVMKNRKMPGRMGNRRVTTKNLKVVAVDAENNTLLVRGAVPGRTGSVIEVRGR